MVVDWCLLFVGCRLLLVVCDVLRVVRRLLLFGWCWLIVVVVC